jgi:Ca2+-binding EF-hand superfamily protein
VNLEKIHQFLKPSGGKGLIQFCKEFKVVDYNISNRLNIDDFIKIISETKIPLNITDIQHLFHTYELHHNSLFFYEEMFKDLKNLYHTDKRARFIEGFYQNLCSKGGQIKLSDLKRLINPRNHPLFAEGDSEEELAMEFYEVVDAFQFIFKLPRNDSVISKEQFMEFFRFFGFGIEQDETFINYVTNLFDLNKVGGNISYNNGKIAESRDGRDSRISEQEVKNYYSNETAQTKHSNLNLNDTLIEKLRVSLKNFGRKSLFYLIKHFKYYDNGTKFINKYDFAKVIKDFRLNLTITDIEKIFELFCIDQKGQRLNYEQFVSMLSERSTNDGRTFLIAKVYEGLLKIAREDGLPMVDIDVVKGLFNGKNHPLGRDEDVNYSEFVECIELFHYAYKNKRVTTIIFEEFEEFYKIISFLMDDDIQFEKVIKSEWKKVLLNNIQVPVKQVHASNASNASNISKPVTPLPKREMTPVPSYRETDVIERTQTPNQIRPTTPLTKNMSQNEKEIALAQNQYCKPRTPVPRGVDAVEKLKAKLRKRGIRGLMNLHKQFLLNCTNPGAISYGDFVKVLRLQKIDFSKDDLDQIFDRFKASSSGQGGQIGTFLNFSGFIRHFKKILSESRLALVEKAFASLDSENSEMLFIEDIKLKFDACSHPEVQNRIKSEDDIAVEFLDCFELNYNFLVIYYYIKY